jgi:ADP-heptose:LPS heptosyltransferase
MLHTIDNYLRTLAPLKLESDDGRHLDFFVPEAARQSAEVLLQESGIGDSETLVLIVPGASTPARQWPHASLAALIEQTARAHPDWRLALIGGPGDRASADAALGHLQEAQKARLLDFIGRTSLKETGALLLRADALVTMDTGPMHLAAAVGTPLIALFGPTSPERTGPAPPPPTARRVKTPLTLAHKEGLECVPCLSRTCARGDLACLARLSPERVLAAIEEQLL